MADKKGTTTMVLKVDDLQCSECYKKVKKVLCKFPQVRDQIYDEKQNTVTIKVVSCCPEVIRDKILCKGKCVIKCIKIPPPPPPPPQPVIVNICIKCCTRIEQCCCCEDPCSIM